MSEIINLDAVTGGLRTIASLRNSVSDLFKCLTEGVGGPLVDPNSGQPKISEIDPTEEVEKQFLAAIQGIVDGISAKIRELEIACEQLSNPSATVNVQLSLLGLDPTLERTGVYRSVVSCYRWCDRMHDYVTQASHLLQQNIYKRNVFALDSLQRIQEPGNIGRRPSFTGINMPPPQIDQFLRNLVRIHPGVGIDIIRPFGSPTVVILTLDRTLKGCIVLHGLLIEWIKVKGINEDFKASDDSVDIWSDSRYEVFRKITEHCNSAALNFASPMTTVDIAIRAWLNWFVNFNSLFSKPCRKCNHRLLDTSPPTWRDFRTGDSFHEKCRP